MDHSENNLTDLEMAQAESDAALAVASGYDPQDFGVLKNMPMTPELQKAISEIKLTAALKDADSNFIQHLSSDADRKKEEDAESLQAQYAVSQKWLNDEHSFGSLTYSGREWRHVADYVRDNEERLREEWRQKGYSDAEIDEGFKVVKTMAKEHKTEQDNQFLDAAKNHPTAGALARGFGEESGIDSSKHAETHVDAKAPSNNPALTSVPSL